MSTDSHLLVPMIGQGGCAAKQQRTPLPFFIEQRMLVVEKLSQERAGVSAAVHSHVVVHAESKPLARPPHHLSEDVTDN
jgi:hypothetical protein